MTSNIRNLLAIYYENSKLQRITMNRKLQWLTTMSNIRSLRASYCSKSQTAAEIKIEVVARRTIRPSSQTPYHLRTFKLCLLDQFVPPIYSPILLFYAGTGRSTGGGTERSQCLKKSLSEILTRYYPVAGRIKDDLSPIVDCNDEGADYLEARVNCSLSDVLEEPRSEALKNFTPAVYSPESGTGLSPLLLVQATFFDCGGIAVGISISHKIADGATIYGLLKAWASAAVGRLDAVVPDFTAASLFPPRLHSPINPLTLNLMKKNCIANARRLVFNSSKIAALKVKAASPSVRQPTRVQAISALLWKCAVAASRSRLGDSLTRQPSVLTWPVNIRARLLPPISSSYSLGNIAVPLVVQATYKSEISLPGSVSRLKEQFLKFQNEHVKRLQGDERLSVILELFYQATQTLTCRAGRVDFYTHTSVCRTQWYEIDFGWGKPSWVRIGDVSGVPNIAMLMDTRDGEGVEAWVSLVEEDMALFEHDPELLAFASVNPSALQH